MNYFRSGKYPIEFVITKDIEKNFSSHNHANHYIISLCTKGSADVTLEGALRHFDVNGLFTVPPFMPHAVSLTDDSVLVYVCLEKSFLADYSQENAAGILKKLCPVLNITPVQENLMLQAVAFVYELHAAQKNELEKDMSILFERLTGGCTPPLPLDRLAEDLYMSKYHLIRKCKKYIGLTPRKFQLQSRIRKAQALLLQNPSITEASVNTGFYDQSHFDRCFKNIVGISPSEYLKSCSKIEEKA